MRLPNDLYAVPLQLLRERYRTPMQWRQIANDARSRLGNSLPLAEDAPPHVKRIHDVWMLAESLAPRDVLMQHASANQLKARRRWLYARRADLWRTIPLHVDVRDIDAVRALGGEYVRVANVLEQTRDELIALRRPPKPPAHLTVPDVETLTNTRDLRKLRQRAKRTGEMLRRAGGQYSTESLAVQWAAVHSALQQHIRNCEQDLYEQRMREWQHDLDTGALAEQGYAVPLRSKPKRPLWLKQAEEREHAAEVEARRCHIKDVPLPKDWHTKEQERQAAVAARRAQRAAANKRSHLEALQQKLLDWVWGEARAWGIGLDVESGGAVWRVLEPAQVPNARQRAHVLASVAVQLSGGEWAFPPCGRG